MSNLIANTLLPSTLNKPIPPQIQDAMNWYFQSFMPILLNIDSPSIENAKKNELNQEKTESFLDRLYQKNEILSEPSLAKLRDTLPRFPKELEKAILAYFSSPLKMLQGLKLNKEQKELGEKLDRELGDLFKANKTSGKDFALYLGKLFYFVNLLYDPQATPILDSKYKVQNTPSQSAQSVQPTQPTQPAQPAQPAQPTQEVSITPAPNEPNKDAKPDAVSENKTPSNKKSIEDQRALQIDKDSSFIEKNKGYIVMGLGAVFAVGTLAAILYRNKGLKQKKKKK